MPLTPLPKGPIPLEVARLSEFIQPRLTSARSTKLLTEGISLMYRGRSARQKLNMVASPHPITRRRFAQRMIVAGGAVVYAGAENFNYVAAQNKVKITQWYHQYGEAGTQQAAQRYAQEYTKANPNVEVDMVWKAGNYADAIAAALLTDAGPDVFEGSPTAAMVKAGQIVPLDDLYIPAVKADVNPTNLKGETIDGKIYAVKEIDDTGCLYYRKKQFADKGLKPPSTFDDLVNLAKELNSGRTKGLFLGNDGGIAALETLLPWSAKQDFLVDNKIVFNTPQTVATYEGLKKLNDTGALLIGSPTDWWDPSAFTQGLAAMQWTGLWAMPGIKKAIGDDFDISPWPAFDAKGSPVTFWGGWAEMVNAKGKHIAESKAFVKWLWIDQSDLQKDWALSYGFHVPPRLSAAKSATPLQSGPASEAAKNLNEYGQLNPPTWDKAMDDAVITAMTNILKNGKPATTEVATAAKKCEEELKRELA